MKTRRPTDPKVSAAREAFGAELRRRRTDRGFTLRDVAIYCETSHVSVLAWETGDYAPSESQLALLREIVGADLPCFCGYCGRPM